MKRQDPIIEGQLAERAQETLAAIAADLERTADEPGPDPTLASGLSGIALFYGYLAQSGSAEAGALCEHLIDRSFEEVGRLGLGAQLYTGFTGVAFVAAHLEGRGLPAQDADTFDEVDNALIGHLSRDEWDGDYDLISGLAGIGAYALERMPSENAADLLKLVVEKLDSLAQEDAGRARWFTPPSLLPPETTERHPDGFYSLGVAHGWPGALVVLAGAANAGIEPERSRKLAEMAESALLDERLAASPSCFPMIVGPGIEPIPARSAWCYGDPGIAASLLAAADAIGNQAMRDAAIDIALNAISRPAGDTGVVDASVCHGAAGLAHLYHRVFIGTQDERFRDASTTWFEKTLELRKEGAGPGGYAVFTPAMDQTWTPDPGFLVGAAGVGLSLLSATFGIEPQWDRLLLASLRDEANP
ncbi:MAG TPA: lanthionine synthetase C family protein [Actinomycetota bacterium]|nr:lanthionine synthetase C family protein [Actinomycetota bacterium]